MARGGWSNWAGNQRCAPTAVVHPSNEDELVAAVKGAAAARQRAKVVGSGHSFTETALTDGHQIQLDRYTRLVAVDRSAGTVTVQAGITLKRLNRALAALGLALPNLGDIEYQTVSGATSTGTHGTGVRLGGLATQIVGLDLVTADGSVLSCSADEEPEVFSVARVGIGALGALSTLTLRCEPAFNLHAVERPERVDALLESLDSHVEDNEHFEFFWVPHTGWALTKRNNRTDEPASPRGAWKSFRDDILVTNAAFGALCRIGRLRPSLIPRLSRVLPSSGPVEYVERSDRVFTSPRMVRFYEMEYSVPREHAVAAVQGVRKLVKDKGLLLNFPVEVRFTAADDIPLSTANGRESCYVAVHVYKGMQYEPYFRGVEALMDELGGRPHWGKMHFQTAATLAAKYPEWHRFQAVRRRLDPDGVFSNSYTERVLGPC